MPESFTITKVEPDPRQWEAKRGPAAGKSFLSYTVEANDEQGNGGRYEITKLPDSPPPELGPGDYTVEQASNPQFLPKLKRAYDGAPAARSSGSTKEDYWDAKDKRIEWAWACNLAATELKQTGPLEHKVVVDRARVIRDQAREELSGTDVGGGGSAAAPPMPPVDGGATADVSADADVGGAEPRSSVVLGAPPAADVSAEVHPGDTNLPAMDVAPPALKARATHLMNQAGLAKPTRQAVIMFRCGTLKDPPKDKLMQLVTDLEQGATHDALVAEIWDAHRAGNPLGTRAKDMLPVETPNAEPPPEDAPDGDDIPF